MNTLTKDPVCGMEVAPSATAKQTVYRGISYYFCSEQCLQRFLAKPLLYVGEPDRQAPKQQGIELIKQRRLRLAAPLSPNQAVTVEKALRGVMGVRQVEARGDALEIHYDLLDTSAELIEEQLASIGVELGNGWSERLRRAFVHYEEENELDNLAANDKHCCDVRKW
jgi:YHS domain-containing protein